MGDVVVTVVRQPVVINVGVSRGLNSVYTDNSLQGNGTINNPLGIAGSILVNEVELVGDGTDTYQHQNLVGKVVISVHTDGIRRKKSEYISYSSTGTVVFTDDVNIDTDIAILYR